MLSRLIDRHACIFLDMFVFVRSAFDRNDFENKIVFSWNWLRSCTVYGCQNTERWWWGQSPDFPGLVSNNRSQSGDQGCKTVYYIIHLGQVFGKILSLVCHHVPYFVQCISEQLKWDAGVTAGRRRGGWVCPPGACPSHPGRSNWDHAPLGCWMMVYHERWFHRYNYLCKRYLFYLVLYLFKQNVANGCRKWCNILDARRARWSLWWCWYYHLYLLRWHMDLNYCSDGGDFSL